MPYSPLKETERADLYLFIIYLKYMHSISIEEWHRKCNVNEVNVILNVILYS